MRYLETVLIALCTTAAVLTAPGGSALAAQGTLTVSGNRYLNPVRGCYTGRTWPLSVDNRTNARVYVYDNTTCTGTPSGSVDPGQSHVFEFGQGAYVPC